MPNWHRVFQPGGTYSFTLVTEHRAPLFSDPQARTILRRTLHDCRARWPFEMLAVVLMPDHLHTIWCLPPGDCAYPTRIGWWKKEFTKAWLAAGGHEQLRSESRLRDRRRGVLQRKYWEHTIRSEEALRRQMDYIHYNPVKHGYVACAREWPWSTFHRYLNVGAYSQDWGCQEPDLGDVAGAFGE